MSVPSPARRAAPAEPPRGRGSPTAGRARLPGPACSSLLGPLHMADALAVPRWSRSAVPVGSRTLSSANRGGFRSFCTTRAHRTGHSGRQPFSDVPVLMHGSTGFSGEVAKWASELACVGMSRTQRRLRPKERDSHVPPFAHRRLLWFAPPGRLSSLSVLLDSNAYWAVEGASCRRFAQTSFRFSSTSPVGMVCVPWVIAPPAP